jgi:hypothetical protein
MTSIGQPARQSGNFRFSGVVSRMRLPRGLRGRLFLAFAGISSFAILAAVAGLVAFVVARRAFDDMTATRLPETLGAMEMMRPSERLVATGPALLNAANADAIPRDHAPPTVWRNRPPARGICAAGAAARG